MTPLFLFCALILSGINGEAKLPGNSVDVIDFNTYRTPGTTNDQTQILLWCYINGGPKHVVTFTMDSTLVSLEKVYTKDGRKYVMVYGFEHSPKTTIIADDVKYTRTNYDPEMKDRERFSFDQRQKYKEKLRFR